MGVTACVGVPVLDAGGPVDVAVSEADSDLGVREAVGDGVVVAVGEDVLVLVIEAVCDGDAPTESVCVSVTACVGDPVLDAGGGLDVAVSDDVTV